MIKEADRNPRKALGKGLSALLPSRAHSPAAAAPAVEQPNDAPAAPQPEIVALPADFEEFLSIPVDQIRSNEEQPRTAFDVEKMQELARSIQANGLLQPITVYKTGDSQYRLIAGERRWRAAQIAGWTTIPALVRNVEQQQRLELALIENIQREDLNPVEIAIAFQHLAIEHHLSHEQIAERTGKDRSTVTNLLRLLRLSADVQNALIRGEISVGHARPLLNIEDKKQQADLCRQIISQGLSVRQTEQLIKELTNSEKPVLATKASGPAGKAEKPPLDPNVRAALDAISAALGTKVTLRAKTAQSGTLEIEYYSQDDLDRIYSVIVD